MTTHNLCNRPRDLSSEALYVSRAYREEEVQIYSYVFRLGTLGVRLWIRLIAHWELMTRFPLGTSS